MTQTRPFAVVTGASTGIGLELAKQCGANHYDLLMVADEPEIHDAADQVRREGGGVEAIDVRILRRMQSHSCSARATALDVDAWVGSVGIRGGASPLLAQQGWRAVSLGPRDRLETVWDELGRGHTSSSRSRGADPTVSR